MGKRTVRFTFGADVTVPKGVPAKYARRASSEGAVSLFTYTSLRSISDCA
jgi:hypothetical protein